uniref:Uncharacterized protein n=1 Tax=Thermosporothrix sp. COM3 TaxID=2490863 RepID=A0A455SUB6_9CHLR|nr:hypothetical protein KTC_52530 [Thermosporothrix sp. COM3]
MTVADVTCFDLPARTHSTLIMESGRTHTEGRVREGVRKGENGVILQTIRKTERKLHV